MFLDDPCDNGLLFHWCYWNLIKSLGHQVLDRYMGDNDPLLFLSLCFLIATKQATCYSVRHGMLSNKHESNGANRPWTEMAPNYVPKFCFSSGVCFCNKAWLTLTFAIFLALGPFCAKNPCLSSFNNKTRNLNCNGKPGFQLLQIFISNYKSNNTHIVCAVWLKANRLWYCLKTVQIGGLLIPVS